MPDKIKNFGASTILTIDYNTRHYALIRFKLSVLPPTARITDARLGLYLEGGASLTNGVFDLHKVTRSWVEGVEDGAKPVAGEGVTYDEYDGANAWDSSGGDYDPTPLSSLTIPALTTGWYEWDVTAQLQAWLAGEPNYGLLLRASSGTVNSIDFTSSDSATSEQHPRLSLTIDCECGDACLIPQGSGKVLLVVGDASNPAAADVEKKELFESWGYEVSYIDDADTQAAFDSALNNTDVAYVSDTVSDGNLADKLAATSKGVINEKDSQTDNLGTSSGSGYTVGESLEIVDTSHEITGQLPAGTLPIYSSPMESVVAAGTLATGLQTLGNAAASPAIAVVEKDGVLRDGGSQAPGRRVMLPFGRSGNFNWSYLNGNGRLIVQRALEWGKTTASTSTLMKVYWTDDQGGKIQRADPDGSNVEDVLTGLNMPTGLALDTDNGKIYWANGNHEIKRANLDGTGKETIYTDSGTVFDVALDLSAGKLYWSNDAPNRIRRANLDGSNAEVVYATWGLGQPAYLGLDTSSGRIYFPDFDYGSLIRVNYDGSGYINLISGLGSPVGIELDLSAAKLYWSDGQTGDSVHRANLDGSAQEMLVSGLTAPQDIAVDVEDGKLYWADALAQRIQRANLDGSSVEDVVTGLNRPRGIAIVPASLVPPTGG
jgi:sugar lactone lactonase YvrE